MRMFKKLVVSALCLSAFCVASDANACWFFRRGCCRSACCARQQVATCSPCQRAVTCKGGSCTVPTCEGGSCGVENETIQDATSVEIYLDAVNKARTRCGLRALILDASLIRECNEVVNDNARRGGLQHLMRGRGVGEIIAYNYSGFAEAIRQWTVSGDHAAHLYSGSYTRVGVALKQSGNRYYCCVKFGY